MRWERDFPEQDEARVDAWVLAVEMDLRFPHIFQVVMIDKGLVTVFEAYAERNPGLHLIARCVVEEARLVRLPFYIYC